MASNWEYAAKKKKKTKKEIQHERELTMMGEWQESIHDEGAIGGR